MPLFLVKLGDQQPSAGFEDPIHLVNCGQLIILSHMMQSQNARNRIEGSISEREVLCERDLEGRRYSALACSAGSAFDHLGCRIDAIDRAGGSHAFSEDDRKAASTAAHVEHLISGLQLKIIGHHGAQTTSPAQPGPQVVDPCPVDELVATVVIGTAGGVDHRDVSVRRSLLRRRTRVVGGTRKAIAGRLVSVSGHG